ncbi:sodium/hydrogen exchanger 8 [Chironomus tepperi]|uniref:sodium/hydrogen exchanger 8 n=1 Tax=Chironomus tepperi TaxID=113505 RepID=UPI00391F717E
MLLKWIVVPYLFIIISSNVALSLEEEIKPSENSLIHSTASINSSNVDANNVTNPTVSGPNEQHESNATETTITSTTSVSSTSTTTEATSSKSSIENNNIQAKNAVEAEKISSMSLFFVLCVIALGILLIHCMLQTNFQYLPESIVTIALGSLIGFILNFTSIKQVLEREEIFSPTGFFLVLLPPIIFESGYNLHKGNFFQNIGSICVFAILGTAISALVIGSGVYLLGIADVAYRLNFIESFAFGSLISAVDPVATIAIFHALDIDPVLNMLVFGESILNDAISIVLTTTVMPTKGAGEELLNIGRGEAIILAINRFCMMFFASAGIGVLFALMSALLLKYVDLRKHPSLELAFLLVVTYCPYCLAEGSHLSGIMAILFCGIVMSHYTHFNLSTVTQITMQQTMRTLAFICETSIFSYLGLAIFSFKHQVELALVIWSIALCLIGRAANIFPLTWMVNKFRTTKITSKMSFIMWFSGLRGAISYALSLHLEYSKEETRRVVITTTLIIVLFTTVFFGGSTLPLLKVLQPGKKSRRALNNNNNGSSSSSRPRSSSGNRTKSKHKIISLSKTREFGQAIDSEHLSELTEEEEVSFINSKLGGFARLDRKYFTPFFTRIFSNKELRDCKSQMTDLTNKWYQAIRIDNNTEDDDEDPETISQRTERTNSTATLNSSRGNMI